MEPAADYPGEIEDGETPEAVAGTYVSDELAMVGPRAWRSMCQERQSGDGQNGAALHTVSIRQPSGQVILHKVVVIEMRIGCTDPVDFGRLAG